MRRKQMKIYILNQKKMKRKKMKINLKKKKRKSRKSRKEKRPSLGPLLCCSKIHYQTKKFLSGKNRRTWEIKKWTII
jgi:hypothetical protein